MRSHTQSVVIEPNRRRITGSISYNPLISDLSVLSVCNKTGVTIKRDLKKNKINHLSLVIYSTEFIARQELNFHIFVDKSGASKALTCPTAYNLYHLTHYNLELPQVSLDKPRINKQVLYYTESD